MLRHSLAVGFIVVLLIAACASQVCAQQPGANLLKNGGFEDGLAQWEEAPGPVAVIDEAPNAARSGVRCLVGEVTQPNTAVRAVQTVRLEAGQAYRMEYWVRSNRGCKSTAFVQEQGGERRRLFELKRAPARWRRCSFFFEAQVTGPARLEVIAPSSHGGTLGKMWVDDVALYKAAVGRKTDLTERQGYIDYPDLVVDDAGTVWASWLSLEEDTERLRLGVLDAPADGEATIARSWDVKAPGVEYWLEPRLVACSSGAWLLAAGEADGNWDIYACRITDRGPGPAVRVTRDDAVDIRPAGAMLGDRLWVAWESNRGDVRQVYAAPVDGGEVGGALQVSAPGVPSYQPAITAEGAGRAWLAWHSFRESNYDVYARTLEVGAESARRSAILGRPRGLESPRYAREGSLGDELRLTTAPSFDRRPALCATDSGVWLAWESGVLNITQEPKSYRIGKTATIQVRLARLGPDGIKMPSVPTPFKTKAEQPSIVAGAQGRIWLGARTTIGRKEGWVPAVACYDGRGWSEPMRLSLSLGRCRRTPIAEVGGRLVGIFQADDVRGRWPDAEVPKSSWSSLYFASTDATSQAGSLRHTDAPLGTLQPLEGDEPLAGLRAQLGDTAAGSSEAERRTVRYGDETLQLFWGQFHEHTSISICNRTGDLLPEDNYLHERDIAALDFAAVTDHGYNFNPYLWRHVAKITRANCDPGRFLTFLAEEWTSTFEEYSPEHPYGFYGHRNIIFADPYFAYWLNARDRSTPADVWKRLREDRVNFVHIPHQLADTGNVPTDWNYTDEVAQPVAEIFQTRGSYESLGAPRQAGKPAEGYYIQDAWAKNIVIGVIASPDHGGGMGKAAIFAPELSREAILDAVRARHTYGTTAARIFLDVRVNGKFMGEKITAKAGEPVTVQVNAVGAQPIERVDVCRSNKFIYTHSPGKREANFTFQDTHPQLGRSYYYVRVIQTDEEIAWSSPVWVEAG